MSKTLRAALVFTLASLIILMIFVYQQFALIESHAAEIERMKMEILKTEADIEELQEFVDSLTVVEMEATAYTHTGNQTKTETWPRVGTVAVDPKFIKLGSRGYVPGYGPVIAEDTGGKVKGNIIDLFMETERECLIWGRRKVTVLWLK